MKEIEIDDPSDLPLGSLVTGRILRIEESLQAVYVDFGAERCGFAPWNKLVLSSVKEGQEVIVRIDEKEYGSKGALVTLVVIDDPEAEVYRVKRSLSTWSVMGTVKLSLVFALIGFGLYTLFGKLV